MPRAHRHYLCGQLWHITQRCHEKAFLLRFPRDRRTYRRWLVEAKQRFGLCVFNIDLNMVRAGVVKHPAAWANGGYREIQEPPRRYTLIDLVELSSACGFANVREFQRAHRQWVDEALTSGAMKRDERWSEAIAVGGHAFVETVKRELGIAARHRALAGAGDTHTLREPERRYTLIFPTETGALRPENRAF